MEDQQNRPHRKTKEKKKHSGGKDPVRNEKCKDRVDNFKAPTLKRSPMPALDVYRNRLHALMMLVDTAHRMELPLRLHRSKRNDSTCRWWTVCRRRHPPSSWRLLDHRG